MSILFLRIYAIQMVFSLLHNRGIWIVAISPSSLCFALDICPDGIFTIVKLCQGGEQCYASGIWRSLAFSNPNDDA